jgi:hypothetical protein
LSAIVDRLLATAGKKIELNSAWKELVFNLVREVVSSVDPDVRAGRDNMDIRPYVKIKVIPGGSIDESVYVDGVVFRKNVSHKKMGANASRADPRILLISEGIEFQRADMKLSSMDTLIEQEEKHMELAVEKIMSLKPGMWCTLVTFPPIACPGIYFFCVDRYHFGGQGDRAQGAGAAVRPQRGGDAEREAAAAGAHQVKLSFLP